MPHSDLVHLHLALTLFFALDGFVFAGWVVRIPAVKEQTGASASALGLALLGVSAGAVVTMIFTGRLCRRYGSHPVTIVCAILLRLSVGLPPLTRSALALGAVLLMFGAAYCGINVAFNSAAVDLVAALRRPIMPSFHAAFSLGGMVAGSLSPTRHLWGLAAIERAGALAGPSGVATASTLGYGGMLLGPSAIGFMADRFSLPAALTSVAVLAAVATVIGFATRKAAPA
ncbi:hypothetical protein GCM10027073_45790 [Streptomyces chlorus]